MKRLLACLLVFSVLLGLAACKKGEDKKSISQKDFDDDDEKEKLPQMQDFAPIIVFDEPGYLVTVTNWDGQYLSLSFENRSADTTYDFDYESCSFNGLSVSESLYCELAPGETDTDTIYLPYEYKDLLGEITHIALTVTIDVNYEQVNVNTIHYYPLGEDAATAYERAPEDSDETIFNTDGLSVIATSYTLDRDAFQIKLFMTNLTDENTGVYFYACNIDGFLVNFRNYYATTVLQANTCTFLELSISTKTLQSCGIRKLENINCELKVTQGKEEPVTHSITFHPQNLFVAKAETDFEPMVVFDKENCYYMEISNVTTQDNGQVSVDVHMENRSQFYSYKFDLADIYTNGVKASAYLYTTLAPGQKTVATLSISNPNSDELGDIRHIAPMFTVTNTEYYKADESEMVFLYPQGRENMYLYQRKIKVTDHVILDNEYLQVVATEYRNSYDGGMQVNLYYYNKGEQPIYVEWENCKLNGIAESIYHSFTLRGNSSYFLYESWDNEFFTENNITQIDSITVDLHLMESNSYDAKAYFTENIELMDKPFVLTTEE